MASGSGAPMTVLVIWYLGRKLLHFCCPDMCCLSSGYNVVRCPKLEGGTEAGLMLLDFPVFRAWNKNLLFNT